MLKYLFLIGLALSPISEARGAIIYGLSLGLNPAVVFVLAVIFNISIIPILFALLGRAHFRRLAERLFGDQIRAKIEKNRDLLNKYGALGLLAFVALPLPITGAWTSTFIAEALGMNRLRAFVAIAAGVLIAATIVFLSTTGVLLIWK